MASVFKNCNGVTMMDKVVSLFDIHGNKVNAITADGKILVPLENIRETGFHLYEKGEIDHVNIDKRLNSEEFGLYMLQAAKEYFLQSRVFSISEIEILDKIKYCKEVLKSPAQNNSEGMRVSDQSIPYRNHPVMSPNNSFNKKLSSFDDFSPNKKQNSLSNSIFSSCGIRQSIEQQTSFSDTASIKSGSGERNENKKFQNKSGDNPKVPSLKLKDIEQMVRVIRNTNDSTWIQALGSNSIQSEISMKIKDIKLETCKVPKKYEVYLAQSGNSWNRSKVIDLDPLKVLFIDLGITREVNELCHMPRDLMLIPCQSLKIQFEGSHYKPKPKEVIKIKPIQEIRSGEYSVELITEEQQSMKPTVNLDSGCFDIPEPLAVLENGQIVLIISEIDGIFALRTKECYRTLNELNKILSECDTRLLANVKKGQLVLCNKTGEKVLFRGVVSSITGIMAEVQYLDYYGTERFPIKSLRNITETLMKYTQTYFTSPRLSEFNDKQLSEKAKLFIGKCIEDKTKFVVDLKSNYFDLKILPDGPFLSQKLVELDLPSPPRRTMETVHHVEKTERFDDPPCQVETPRQVEPPKEITTTPTAVSDQILYSEMQFTRIDLGPDLYQCYFKSPEDVTLISTTDETIQNMQHVVITDCTDSVPYEPKIGEMCLGLYEDEWYRCVVNDIYGDKFLAIFVDYGNVEMLKSENLRKFPRKLKKIPILGMKCKLCGLPNIKEKSVYLKELICDADIITVDIKRMIKPNEYEIEMPEIYKKLNEQSKEK